MGKAGEKQKRKPKIKDKRQSERFKETAREIGADQPSWAFDKIVSTMAQPKKEPPFVLKGTRGGEKQGQIREEFPTLRKALERAATLFDALPKCMLEIFRGNVPVPICDILQMDEWNRNGRPLPQE